MWSLSPNRYLSTFAALFAVLVGVAAAAYVMSTRSASSQEWVVHTQQVIAEIAQLSEEFSQAESARRGFVLIGDRALLIDLDDAQTTLSQHLRMLESLTTDNPRQHARVAELQTLLPERMSLLRQSIDLRQRDASATEQQAELTRRGVSLDDKIRLVLESMEDDENRLLNERSRMSAARRERATLILMLAFLMAAIMLATVFLLMYNEVKRRTRAESISKENEEKIRLLVNGIHDHAIVRVDLQGRITTWNSGAERLFGFRSWEILGEAFHRLYNKCESDTPQRHLNAAFEHGHVNDECLQVRKDGSEFWATAEVTLLRDEEGEPRGYAVITRDITERKQHREEIEHREQQLNAFFSNAPVGLAIVDRELHFQRINVPFAQLNGLDARQQVGKPLRDVVAELFSQLEPLLAKAFQTGEAVLNHEVKGPIPTTPEVKGWWLKSIFPIAWEGDSVTQLGIVVQDVTGLKRAETAVRRLTGRLLQIRDDERRRLARDLHDSLGQTLTAAKMNLSYLGRDTSSMDERGRNAVMESRDLIDGSLKEVRTLSHLLHPPMLDEVGLVPAIRWFASGFAERSTIQVDLDLPTDLARMRTELETAVFRTVQESLTNVHRHSGSATATVRVETEGDQLHVFVIDQGRGIAPERLSSRQDATLGVGLLGMRERLRQLQGEMEIISSGQGTTIHAIIPLSEVP
jgi:PAS domain S-box-containing protein